MKTHSSYFAVAAGESAHKRRKWLVLVAIALSALSSTRVANAQGNLYFVNTTSDTVVANACANGLAGCSLRGAIQAANAHPGEDGIEFNLPAGSVINLTAVLPDVSDNVAFTGPGADKLTVRRDMGGDYRVFNVTATGTVAFTGLTISDGIGGIINNNAATLNVTNCIISGNSTAAGLGGAIYNNSTGPVNVTNTTMSANSAGRGGALFNNSTATMTVINSTISDNLANGSSNNGGGGIYNNSTGTVNIINSRLALNRVIASGVNSASGGGIFNASGTVNVTNTTLETNRTQCPNSNASGGGIYNESGIVNVANSAFRSNRCGPITGENSFVAASGGGIFNQSGAVNVTNCTLSSNSLLAINSGSARGGGIFINTGTVNVTNSTLSSNFGSAAASSPMMFGGGIFNATGIVNVKSAIIALNELVAQNGTVGSNPDASGPFTSQGFNLIGKRDGSTGFTQPTDQTGTVASPLDPKLDPVGLRDNGGPTQTVALAPGSPAIDKGTSHCSTCGLTGILTTDQRDTGFARAFDDPATPNAAGGDGTDIGAFEAQTSLVTRLANISTRLPVQTGDNVLIGGFIITGTQPKKVMLRAIGPSLSFPNKLANPTLELFGPSGPIESNDNWVDSPNKQAIIDSTIPPSDNLESAIVATLPANNAGYTAIVRGVNDGTGIGVVEVYDLDQAEAKLANISTRGFVQTGDDILIAGTIILGPNPQEVIIRAIGPSLSIGGKLENPTLELRNQNGAPLQTNDNWVDSPDKQAIIDSMVPPTNDLESAIVATLPANGASYTAILRGANNTTGIAVVEVYALQ